MRDAENHSDTASQQPPVRGFVPAFAVHVFTATGAGFGFAALLAATRGTWVWMFIWLGAALIVDGVDGSLARRFRVNELAPRWSGATLDLVVDFVTYVFVPAYAITVGGFLPDMLAIPLGALIVVTAALYFADGDMKLAGNYFHGFPTLWNAVAFYFFVLRPGPLVCAAIIVVLAGLTFAPIRFVHPVRVVRLRPLTIGVLVLWAVLAALALLYNFACPAWISIGLGVTGVYVVAIGSITHLMPSAEN